MCHQCPNPFAVNLIIALVYHFFDPSETCFYATCISQYQSGVITVLSINAVSAVSASCIEGQPHHSWAIKRSGFDLTFLKSQGLEQTHY